MSEAPKTLQAARALDDFVIRKFRGLSDVSLRQLGVINLLVGGNNSGKTSVLEALAVFSAPLDIVRWSSIARHREARRTLAFVGAQSGLSGVEAVRWLFPQSADFDDTSGRRSDFHLTCSGKWAFEELRAHCESIRGIPPKPPRTMVEEPDSQQPVEEEGWLVSAKVLAAGATRNSIEVQLWPSVRFYTGEGGTGPHLPAILLPPYSHRNQPLQLKQLSELIQSDEKLGLIELLQELDPDIRDLPIITDRHTGSPTILVRHNRSGAVPISVMGDGFRRALGVALSLPSARGGLLLIDEIETALHVSFLEKLFAWLIRACENFNVQLFATTHSLEAVSAMVNATPPSLLEGITAYHLDSTKSTKRYSSEMLARLVRDKGLDIR